MNYNVEVAEEMQTICVAGVVINVDSADKEYFTRRYKEYEVEYTDNPDMWIKTERIKKIDEPQGELVENIRTSYIVKTEDGKLCRYAKSSKTGKIAYAIYYTEDYSDVRIVMEEGFIFQKLNNRDWEYLYTGFMFANRLTNMGGTVLHSSGMAYKDSGIVFSADPGTGKSTHVSLWKERFQDDVQIVNDDKPALRIIDDKFYMFGTPWSGKTELNINTKKELKAIFFIERGTENKVERMSVADSVLNLSRQLPNPFYDKNVGIKTVKLIEKLYALNVPIYRLRCSISQDAVSAVYNEIFGGK